MAINRYNGDVDPITQKDKEERDRAWFASETYCKLHRDAWREGIFYNLLWVVISVLTLIVGIAVLKWAVEELAH